MTEEPRKRCPQCRGKVMRIVTGGGGYILKGSGFYATDYRDGSYKKDAEKDKPAPKKEKSNKEKSNKEKKKKKGPGGST
jgi:predicted nucleic acid-binding Zn ribbon protein